jgi:hypothetical protein
VLTVLALDDPLPALGEPPLHGRGFTAEELARGGPSVAIISHRLWSTMFGADPKIIGRTIQVNSQSRTVVGVTAPGSTLIGADLWIPWGGSSGDVPRNRRQFTVIARLARANLTDANAELGRSRGRQQFSGQFPDMPGWQLRAAT